MGTIDRKQTDSRLYMLQRIAFFVCSLVKRCILSADTKPLRWRLVARSTERVEVEDGW